LGYLAMARNKKPDMPWGLPGLHAFYWINLGAVRAGLL